jgi:S-adenosylmethionine decarboxylase
MTQRGLLDRRSLGVEWVIDAEACSPAALRDLSKIQGVIDQIVRAMALHPVETPLVHRFPGEGGITALVLLAESHLTIHTFPELRAATLNVYCCRPRSPLDWSAVLASFFGASQVHVRSLTRGQPPGAQPP